MVFCGEEIVMTGFIKSTEKLTILKFQLSAVSFAYTIRLFTPSEATNVVLGVKETLGAPFRL